jgi:hypothetical protein
MKQSLSLWQRLSVSYLMATVLFLISYFVARFLLETNIAAPFNILAALLPVPFAFLWISKFIQHIRQLDELERRIHLEALALAFPLTFVLLMTLGLLELTINLPAEDWSYRHVWAMLPILYLLGLITARRRYA